MIIRKLIAYFLFILFFLGITNCAKMGSLTGGPKDEDPPRVVESSPENYSLQFDRDKIEITFDEFIQLDNVNQQLVVSPPLSKKPVVRLKNKTLLIELEEDLRENTTYTLNFGGAIKDNNEGNPLTNFEFVFSTGDYLDSLTIGGTLLNAFDLKPSEEPVMVMLYDDLSDSVVFKDIPVYVGKSEKDGSYRINNLKADTFKLFALKDVNNNFLFDQPNEVIAFLDTTVIIDPEFFSKIIESESDTLRKDSLALSLMSEINPKKNRKMIPNKEDIPTTIEQNTSLARENSAAQDTSISKEKKQIPDRIMVDLFLFTEKNEIQFLSNHDRKARNKLNFNFNMPVTDSFHFQSLVPASENWYLKETSLNRDTFALWIINDEVEKMDSILLELNYVIKDSLNKNAWKKDSLLFFYREPQKSTRKKEAEKETVPVLNISTFGKNATIELNQKASFLSETPVNHVDTSKIEFYIQKDTLFLKEDYTIFKDSLNFRKVIFDKTWEEGAKYHFISYPGAFMDVYGATNDTIDVKFSVRKSDYYGTLIVSVENLNGPLVIQLLDPKEKVLREKSVTEQSEIRFEYLKPGKYKIKMIHDSNENGAWDTGKYILGLQPERIEYLKGEIEIRANWELKITLRPTY